MTASNPPPDGERAADSGWRVLSPREVFERARGHANKAPAPLRQSLYLYYISRYQVSLYETAFGAMPRQLLNEYRSGLDHFMRFLSSGNPLDNDDEHHNLHKMERHLQRAVLDICKYHAYKMGRKGGWLDEFESEHGGPAVLGLVSDGEFCEELQCARARAERALAEAKLSDDALGEDLGQNDRVVGAYMDAAYLWQGVRALCLNKKAEITRARKEYGNIAKKAESLSMKKQIAISVGVGLVVGIILFLVFG